MPRAPKKQDPPQEGQEDPQEGTGEDTPSADTPTTDGSPQETPEGYKRTLPGEFNPAVQDLLMLAQDLEDERAAVMTKVAANRDSLRNYITLGMMNADQQSAVQEFYPKRTRKVKGEDNGEATPDADTTDTTETPAETAA